MTSNLAIPLPGSEPPQAERRIKWTCDAEGAWTRVLVQRLGNSEFVIAPIPDLEIAAQTATEKSP